ncbi:LuxR family transcriptional regulator [Trinickia dinghuensis]|uniref:LuxR family transcriptional regulator n=1 Tax=Trinickia dinghuensis TaxID=2291023 RepID=A0A3D8JW96_9BURK|nr:LuxR family transcriptional regulator [Trinickia dinghuensis]RDU97349.1 LuxR family transcriptional regulator [Trinickia dinghuensis]
MSDSLPSALALCQSTTRQVILGLINHDTEARLVDELEHITKLMRFDFYHYVGTFSVDDNSCVRRTLSNLPTAWREKYADFDGSNPDPIAQAAHFRVIPILWNESQFGASDHDNFYKTACEHGVGKGIILPVHSRNGDAAALGLFMRTERDDEDTIAAALGDAGLTAMYLHDAMSRMVSKTPHSPKAPLTHREIECLHWIAHHKSNWAIAKILGISEHGVVYYVRRIMWKLDAHNRYQAVARATAYGLI